MECKKCGKTIADDSTFCIYCGARVDDKKTCPKCGTVIEDDTVSCLKCGYRLDGKKVCNYCGEVLDGEAEFCSKCGKKLENKNTAKVSTTFSKIEKILSPSLLVLSMVILFICCFFINVTGKIDSSLSSLVENSTVSNSSSSNIFYFFGKVYK